MTEAKLRELQQLSGCKNILKKVLEHFDEANVDVTISVDHYDVEYARMYTKLYADFHQDLKQFLLQQYNKYKEAFDNA